MAEAKRKAPCFDCPFRKESTPGWLGASGPKQFLRTTLAEHEMPCHVDTDYDNPEWQHNITSLCAGSLIFFKNNYKVPRDASLSEAVRAVEASDKVFRNAREFLDHHTIETNKGEPSMECDMFLGIPIDHD